MKVILSSTMVNRDFSFDELGLGFYFVRIFHSETQVLKVMRVVIHFYYLYFR